jgi:hypothetical protein
MQFENACGQTDLKRTEIGAGDATPAPILVVICVVRSVKFGEQKTSILDGWFPWSLHHVGAAEQLGSDLRRV